MAARQREAPGSGNSVPTSAVALASEALFHNVVANIPGAVYRCEPREPWPVHLVTEGIEEICGHPASEFVNGQRTFGSLIVDEDLAPVAAGVADALRDHGSFTLEYRIRHKDGAVRWVSERGRAVFADDGR